MSNFSIYSILNEAPGDPPQQDNNQQNQNNDNFDIDTSLDDIEQDMNNATGDAGGNPDNNDLEINGDENPDDTQDGTEGTGDTGGGGNDTDDEPVDYNTDVFASLSAEEQAMKISQLKKQFLDLYNSCNDILEKVSNIESTESNIIPINRINSTADSLKTYIADYLFHIFSIKSYYENDVMFNRFLSIFKSIHGILEDIFKQANKENNEK